MSNGLRAYDSIKRVLDVSGAALGLIILSPLLGILAIAVSYKLGSPVIFRQQRPGKNGKLFVLYKFRSMKIIDESDDVENDHLRLTDFGRKLRSTSLDELPSLYNVLRGDMSFVGPRPLLAEYIPLYTEQQARRHEVRPGITGLAQVNGRNDMTWENKLRLDIEYIERRSLRLDASILWRTLRSVLRKDGISKAGSETTDRFTGG